MLDEIKLYTNTIASHDITLAEYGVKLAEAKLLIARKDKTIFDKSNDINDLEMEAYNIFVEFDEYKRTYPTKSTLKAKAPKPRKKDPLNKYDCEEGEKVANLFDGNDCDILDKEEEEENSPLFAKS